MRSIVLYCICIVVLFVSGCTLKQMYYTISDKLSSPSSSETTNAAANQGSETPQPAAQQVAQTGNNTRNIGSTASNLESNRQLRTNVRSRAYGPKLLGFQLGQTYQEAAANAERLGKPFAFYNGLGQCAPQDATRLVYASKQLEAGHQFMEALLNQMSNGKVYLKQGDFIVSFSPDGHVINIWMNDDGLRLLGVDCFGTGCIKSFSRLTRVNLNIYKHTEDVEKWGDVDMYSCYASGNGWQVKGETTTTKGVSISISEK